MPTWDNKNQKVKFSSILSIKKTGIEGKRSFVDDPINDFAIVIGSKFL